MWVHPWALKHRQVVCVTALAAMEAGCACWAVQMCNSLWGVSICRLGPFLGCSYFHGCRSFYAIIQGFANLSKASSWRRAPISTKDCSVTFLRHCLIALTVCREAKAHMYWSLMLKVWGTENCFPSEGAMLLSYWDKRSISIFTWAMQSSYFWLCFADVCVYFFTSGKQEPQIQRLFILPTAVSFPLASCPCHHGNFWVTIFSWRTIR